MKVLSVLLVLLVVAMTRTIDSKAHSWYTSSFYPTTTYYRPYATWKHDAQEDKAHDLLYTTYPTTYWKHNAQEDKADKAHDYLYTYPTTYYPTTYWKHDAQEDKDDKAHDFIYTTYPTTYYSAGWKHNDE